MRKFTYTDVNGWKVVNNTGKTVVTQKDGRNVKLKGFTGYRAALQAAQGVQGIPVRE